ncbi:MAG: NusA-like transcription termination signal-binding factor, partial [Candidatus Methanomethylicaceae archaeon]
MRLTADEMRYIALLENLTGAIAKDCVLEPEGNRIIFVIRPGDMGLAIGKNGVNIERARKVIGRNVEI